MFLGPKTGYSQQNWENLKFWPPPVNVWDLFLIKKFRWWASLFDWFKYLVEEMNIFWEMLCLWSSSTFHVIWYSWILAFVSAHYSMILNHPEIYYQLCRVLVRFTKGGQKTVFLWSGWPKGGRGVSPLGLTISKCENGDPFQHWNLILWYSKHILLLVRSLRNASLRLFYTAIWPFCVSRKEGIGNSCGWMKMTFSCIKSVSEHV